MHFRHSILALTIVVVVCLIPVLLWLGMKPLADRFGSTVTTLTSIGQLSALLGTAMFSVALILIARLPFLEKLFGGLDRVFLAHRHLGFWGFTLMLVHPLALAFRLVPSSVADAASFLLPDAGDIPKTLGIVALLCMMVLIVITFFTLWRYETVLSSHRLLGIAFILGALHGLLIPSDASSNLVLALYVGVLAILGVSAYTYRTLGKALIPKRYYRVSDVRALTPSVTELVLSPFGKPLSFTPGQFIFISFVDPVVKKEVHPFSISSSPFERELRITVKALGDFTRALPRLSVGSSAIVEGPYGGFTEERATKQAEVWVAGGIGITPFLSRARAYAQSRAPKKRIDLFYACQTKEDMVYLEELQDIARNNPSFRVFPHVSAEKGRLTIEFLKEWSEPLEERDVFLCGPVGMMRSITQQCKTLGLHTSQIHAEEFSLL